MTRHIKPNEWQKRYGDARRAADRALIEEAERQIALEDDIREAVIREFADRSALTTSSRPVDLSSRI
jgi:hypothetical protein